MTLRKPFLVLSLCLSSLFVMAQNNESLQCKMEEINYKLNVNIILTEKQPDSWKSVTYEMINDEKTLLRYLDLLSREYAKYPSNYFRLAHVNTIILCWNLKFKGQSRAAIPDPYKKQLFLSVNGAYGIFSHRYLAHVMHHELHHCTEYAIWKNMSHDWEDWLSLNTDNFCYGEGGAAAYTDYIINGIDLFSPINPYKGFINRYSLTGDEEDRAELVAFLMADFDRPVIEKLIRSDEIIHKKSLLLCELLSDFTAHAINFPQGL